MPAADASAFAHLRSKLAALPQLEPSDAASRAVLAAAGPAQLAEAMLADVSLRRRLWDAA